MSNLKRVFLILVAAGSMSIFTACGNSATTPQSSTTGAIAAVNGQCSTSPYLNYSNGLCYTTYQGTNTNTSQGIAPVNGQCSVSPYLYLNSSTGLCYTTNNGTNLGGTNTCSSGYVKTSYGCLPQGQCGVGYGFGYWNGQPWCFPQTY